MVSAIILIHILTVANLAAIHSKRMTLQKRDMALVRSMRSGILGHTFRRESYSNILIHILTIYSEGKEGVDVCYEVFDVVFRFFKVVMNI